MRDDWSPLLVPGVPLGGILVVAAESVAFASMADVPYAVNYFVNDSTVARVEFRPSPAPDPRDNGTVVEKRA